MANDPIISGPVAAEAAEKPVGPPVVSRWKIFSVWLCRIILGGTFIFSGFTKAVDPMGTVFKMQEYIGAFGLSEWDAVCLPLAFLLFTIEFMTGVYILTGCYRRLAPWTSAVIMAGMLPLTLWIALKNPVPDCGCFGDAWIISNWATFWKNIVLTLLTVWLLLNNRKARCLVTPALQWIAFCGTVLFALFIGWVGYFYQPLIDFRPYPVGSAIAADAGEETAAGENDMSGVWERDGERITIPLDSIPGDDWEFVERVESAAGKNADSDSDRSLAAVFDTDGEDVTQEIFEGKDDRIILFYSSLADISAATFYRTNSLRDYCAARNVDLFAIAAATPEQIETFRDLSLSEFPIYIAEDTWIKEVVRGNPGVVFMRDGKVVWKSTLTAMPSMDFMSSDTPADPIEFKRDDSAVLGTAILVYLSFMALLCILSFIPSVVGMIYRRRHNRFIKGAGAATVLALSLSFTSCKESGKEGPQPPVDPYASTTLIYMVGNNDLSSNLWNDIEEMYRGCEDIDTRSDRVIVYLAQPRNIPGYSDNLPGLYGIITGPEGEFRLQRLKGYASDVNSVDPGQISRVIEDLREISPSETYGLFLWSHASGWLPRAGSFDETERQRVFGDDYKRSIDIEALASALPDGMFSYIWFDCCLMGGIESCYALRDKAGLIVSSPTEIMAEGAPYHYILPYVARREPAVVDAVEAECRYYLHEAEKSLGFTISVVDCSFLRPLALACREIVSPQFPYISTSGLQQYGIFKVTLPDGRRIGMPFYDFGQVYTAYARERGIDPSRFEELLSKAVIYKAATQKFAGIPIDPLHFSGLSVHVPLSPEAYGYNALISGFYETLSWTKAVI